MFTVDEIPIHNDEAPRLHSVITSGRAEHYSDVVDYMARAAVTRYVQKHKKNPSPSQIEFLKKELARYAVIRKDLKTAQALEINESNILIETGCQSG